MHPMNQKNSIRQGLNLMKKKTYIYLLALVPFLIVAMLYEVVPLITVIVKSFQPDGGTGFTLENYQSVFSKLLYQKAIINSIKISLTSAVAGIIIAFLGARAAHQHQGKLNHVFMTVLNMVSNFAGIPLAFAYMILLGNAGLVVNIGKELGINALSTYNLYTMNGMSLIYNRIDFGERKNAAKYKTLHVTIPEDLDYTGVFDEIFADYAEKWELVTVKTTNMGSLYKLTYQLTMQNTDKEKEMIDRIRCRNGNLEINLSRQDTVAAEL